MMTITDELSSNLQPVSISGGVDELLRRVASLPESSSCEHPVSVNLVCIDCHRKIEKTDVNGLDFEYIREGLRLSRSEINRLRSVETKKLLSQKKLHLVLDIDHTLLHAMDPEAFPKHKVTDETSRVERVGELLVKLRPLVSDFLETANSMFEMYLYTLANRSYAKDMAKLLDPQGKYSGQRIITRDDLPNMIKTLDLVLGEESCVLIVDDTKKVWQNHDQNLILMKRFVYTGNEATDESETNTPLKEIMDVLYTIHKAYFGERFNCKDVRDLATKVRSTVLKGCTLYMMSNVKAQLWVVANELGATCCNELSSSVTHAVSSKEDGKVFKWATKEKKYFVNPQWIEEAYYRWLRPSEEGFSVKPRRISCCSILKS